MNKYSISLIMLGLLVAFSCQEKINIAKENEEAIKADIQAIRNVSMAVVKTWNEGDYEGFMKFFDDDAILLPQNVPSVKGIQAVSSLYRNSFNNLTFKVSDTIEETQVFGDYAYELGNWTGSMNPKDGSTPITFNNKVICIYKRQADRSWKIYRWMYSSNEVPEELHISEIPEK